MRLEQLNRGHESGYLAMIADFEAAGERYRFNDADLAKRDFAAFIAEVDNEAAGIGLPPGVPAQTSFVLIDANDHIVGELRFRPTATEPYQMSNGHLGYNISPRHRRRGHAVRGIHLVLAKAADHGLTELVFPVEVSNVASQAVA